MNQKKGGVQHGNDIPHKANRVLQIILISIFFIIFRIWHLSFIQYDQKVQEANKPRHRVIVEGSKRASIRDRYGAPLAINKNKYIAQIDFSKIRQLPLNALKRREYVKDLSSLIAAVLALDPLRVEDLIWSKAALYSEIPYTIKEGLLEDEYFRLVGLEKDYPGLLAKRATRRDYPLGRFFSDIIGYMGAINREEFERNIAEMRALKEYLKRWEDGDEPEMPEEAFKANLSAPDEVLSRLKYLENLSYSISDTIGKAGIEGKFEKSLRGLFGKKYTITDAKGRTLKEEGGQPPRPGHSIFLTISSELQSFAEGLLIKNEKIRRDNQKSSMEKVPWIRGGAIIAIDPENGEVLALASYPRFDPNDFISSGDQEKDAKKRENVHRWLEDDSFLESVWDQRTSLKRESFDKKRGLFEEEVTLHWKDFLDFILPEDYPSRVQLLSLYNLEQALLFQSKFQELMNRLKKSPQETVLWLEKGEDKERALREEFLSYFGFCETSYDKLLLLDLCHLVVPFEEFDLTLIPKIGNQSLDFYHDVTSAHTSLQDSVKEMAEVLFHELDFKEWREKHQKEFLKEKRALEKQEKKWARPYIDYLDAKEKKLFLDFWNQHQLELLMTLISDEDANLPPSLKPYSDYFSSWRVELEKGAHPQLKWRDKYLLLKKGVAGLNREEKIKYIKTLKSFKDLKNPLYGNYRFLGKENGVQLQKHLAKSFYPFRGFGFTRSESFRKGCALGSIFKLILAYEALRQYALKLKKGPKEILSFPLIIHDQVKKLGNLLSVATFEDGTPIPRIYKGGRVPKSLAKNIGRADLVRALEMSSNPYFAVLASDYIEDPEDLAHAARLFSFGEKTGIDLPGEISGNLPNDLKDNRTGLYSFAIGQHTLVVTPLQTAVMLSALSNGGKVLKPQIIQKVINREAQVFQMEPHVKDVISHLQPIKGLLYQGMKQVVKHILQDGIQTLKYLYTDYPEAIQSLYDLKDDFIGKSSSAESMEYLHLGEKGVQICNHIWFGGIFFKEEDRHKPLEERRPELVVVVFFKHAGYGNHAAPIACEVAKEWRKIKKLHSEKTR